MKYLIAIYLLPVYAIAQESTTTVEPTALEKAPGFLADLLSKMQDFVDPVIVGGISGLVALLFAGKKSLKILKVIVPLAASFKALGAIFTWIGETLDKLVQKVK